MDVTELSVTKYLSAASFVLALTATTAALAAKPLPSAGTLTIPAPFGSSPVLTWGWGVSNYGTTNPGGGGGGVGRASFRELSISRNADGQSPLFFKYVTTGLHLTTVVLVDGSTTITLTDVLVTNYLAGDADAKDKDTPSETISFEFSKLAYTVNGVTTCFNIKTNTPC